MTTEQEVLAKVLASLDHTVLAEREAELKLQGLSKASKDPDIPACDACGKEFSANLICGRCQSAFYCSKDCQKIAWKHCGHKQECGGMKEECVHDAEVVVQALTTRSNEDCARMECGLLKHLDGAGAYKAAVAQGLHEAMCGIFRDDAEHVLDRFRNENGTHHVWSATRTVMSSLFRGQRAEGRGTRTSNFGCVDGQRIKAFVNSNPAAFDIWMDASIATILLPFDSQVWRRRGPSSNGQHAFAHRAARDVIAGWILVWMNKRASRAILLPSASDDSSSETVTQTPDQAALARVQSIVDRLRALLEEVDAHDERDPGGGVTGMINQTAAMVSYRVREFEIDFDFVKQLKLKNLGKNMYEQIAIPLGEATIEKNATLTNPEAKAAIAEYAQRQQQPSRRGRR
jgi:hypothetical protein